MADISKVAIVGAGLVGSGWAIVFARAGMTVRVFDGEASIRASVLGHLADSLAELHDIGLVDDVAAVLGRISVADTLAEALAEADYIQESVFERTDVKTAVSLEIDRAMRPEAIVGSSSSGIPASAFTEGCTNRGRFVIAHPVNPPHLVPVVELVPAPWTDPDVVPAVRELMDHVGQEPVVVYGQALLPRGPGFFAIAGTLGGEVTAVDPRFAPIIEFEFDDGGRAVSFTIRGPDERIHGTGVRDGG